MSSVRHSSRFGANWDANYRKNVRMWQSSDLLRSFLHLAEKRIFRVSRLVPNPESAVRLTEFDLVGRSAPISHQREGVPPGLDEAVARFSVSGNDISKITIRCPNVKILEIIKPDGPSLLDVNGITYDVGSDDEDAEETKEEET